MLQFMCYRLSDLLVPFERRALKKAIAYHQIGNEKKSEKYYRRYAYFVEKVNHWVYQGNHFEFVYLRYIKRRDKSESEKVICQTTL